MNGERTFGKAFPDGKISTLMNAVINGWFKKWRGMDLTDESFAEAAIEMDRLLEEGEDYPLVRNLCITLLYELDARMHGGYTETSKNKLLSLIKDGPE